METTGQMRKNTLELMRHNLSLVDISDVQDKDQTEDEHKEYVAAISAVFPRLEKDITKLINIQLLLTFQTADDMDKIALGQGNVNGMTMLLEYWRKAFIEHSIKSIPENFDKNSPISEI